MNIFVPKCVSKTFISICESSELLSATYLQTKFIVYVFVWIIHPILFSLSVFKCDDISIWSSSWKSIFNMFIRYVGRLILLYLILNTSKGLLSTNTELHWNLRRRRTDRKDIIQGEASFKPHLHRYWSLILILDRWIGVYEWPRRNR